MLDLPCMKMEALLWEASQAICQVMHFPLQWSPHSQRGNGWWSAMNCFLLKRENKVIKMLTACWRLLQARTEHTSDICDYCPNIYFTIKEQEFYLLIYHQKNKGTQTTIRTYRTTELMVLSHRKPAFSVLLGMELTPCNPSTCEAGAAQIQCYPGRPITLQTRPGYGKTLSKERKEDRQ